MTQKLTAGDGITSDDITPAQDLTIGDDFIPRAADNFLPDAKTFHILIIKGFYAVWINLSPTTEGLYYHHPEVS